jgi:adenosine deaminase
VGSSSRHGRLRRVTAKADRIRHGFWAAEDPALVRDLADRRKVIDVCPFSNLRTGAVASLDAHPLPRLHREGVPCSLSTDDPAMFDTDLTREYDDAVQRWGINPASRARSATTTRASGCVQSATAATGVAWTVGGREASAASGMLWVVWVARRWRGARETASGV